jgi:putative flippase GtrA
LILVCHVPSLFVVAVPKQVPIPRLVRFLVVGVCTAAVDFSALWLLSRWLAPTVAFSCAYAAGVVTHFLLNKYWTFHCARTDLFKQAAEYLAVLGITYLVQLVGFRVGLAIFHNIYLARVIAVPPSTLAGFYLLKIRVFREAAVALGQED